MHRMPVVPTMRWPCTVTAVAPPFHIAFTTAWMSCWCTTSRLGLSPGATSWPDGASLRVTVTPGPIAGSSPAGLAIWADSRLYFATCLLFTDPLSRLTCWWMSATRFFSASTDEASLRTIEARSVNRPGRRSVPSLLWALTTKSVPTSSPTSGVATRQTSERRGRGCGTGAGPPSAASYDEESWAAADHRRRPRSLRWGRSVMPTKVARVV